MPEWEQREGGGGHAPSQSGSYVTRGGRQTTKEEVTA